MREELFRPDLEAVLKHYSAELPWSYSGTGWAKIGCPWPDHDDSNPSATANLEAGKVNCFGCGQHGDALDLIGSWEVLDVTAASEFAREHFPAAENAGEHKPRASRTRGHRPGRRAPVRRDRTRFD